MKTKTKIFIALFCVLFVGLIIVVKTAERSGSGIIEQSYNMLAASQKEQLRNHNAAAEGNAVYEENVQSGSGETNQAIADYVESVKEIFKGNEHLLDSADDADLAIDLKMFKQGEEYRFGDMFWNITFEQVSNIVPYSLLEDPDRMQTSEGYTYYVSEDKYTLYGQMATASFEFEEDHLKAVSLTFEPAKKTEALYDSVVEALTDICGKDSEQFKNKATGYDGYKWESGNTMLQVSTDGIHVVITVGLR